MSQSHMMMCAPANAPSATVNSNNYVGSVVVGIAVPLADADALLLLGWSTNHAIGNGTTAQRPVGWMVGSTFHDDSLGIMITLGADGNWRNGSGQIV